MYQFRLLEKGNTARLQYRAYLQVPKMKFEWRDLLRYMGAWEYKWSQWIDVPVVKDE